MEKLKAITDDAKAAVDRVVGAQLSEEQLERLAKIIEQAVIKGVLEGQNRAVDACIGVSEAEQDLAHKIAIEIRRGNDALIANLSSLR